MYVLLSIVLSFATFFVASLFCIVFKISNDTLQGVVYIVFVLYTLIQISYVKYVKKKILYKEIVKEISQNYASPFLYIFPSAIPICIITVFVYVFLDSGHIKINFFTLCFIVYIFAYSVYYLIEIAKMKKIEHDLTNKIEKYSYHNDNINKVEEDLQQCQDELFKLSKLKLYYTDYVTRRYKAHEPD